MKKMILSLLAIIFLFSGNIFAETKNENSLTVEEFKKQMAEAVVIDIRTPEEIILGKISQDSLELNYYDKNFDEELDKLDKSKKYLIYCAHGNRTREAKEKMKELGFKEVYDLKGGVVLWSDTLVNKPDKESILNKYKGKMTVIILAGTFCPHCQDEIPKIEKEIFSKVGNQINLLINVVDSGEFKTKIKQESNPSLDYEVITGEKCGYVPSWIILDKDSEVLDKSCGNRKGIEKIITTLKNNNIIFTEIKENKNVIKDIFFKYWIYFLVLIFLILSAYFILRD